MTFGLKDSTIERIRGVFANHPEVEKAVLYGSRAKGTYKNGSDIDLTLHGDGLTLQTMNSIANEIDDLMLPYMFDLSIYSDIKDPDMLEHIERVGVVFYERTD
ncbi:MAG: nucleotidyltransferase domain-containing protein [Nitrospirae bacterium]|nr:nucleotidyltransferase domain-containing protein [Nitrospirota bacterium]